MKAIQVSQHGDIDVLQLVEKELPTPGPEELVINLYAAGVNPVDTYIRAGVNNYTANFPYTPGKDGAGIVAAVGEAVSWFKPGDRVFCTNTGMGCYADTTICSQDHAYPLPDNLSFAQGACLGIPYGTAWLAIHQRAGAITGETILIHGASGGVGLAAIELGNAHGLTVIGTASTEPGTQAAYQQGADQVFNHYDQSHWQAIKEYTDNQGVDIILEMLANVNLGQDLPLLSKKGRVIIIGSRGEVSINPRDLMARNADIRGLALANASLDERQAMYNNIVELAKDGKINPVVHHSFSLEQAGQAHQQVLEKGAAGNIVLITRPE
ncbi:NADPH:quinone reductase [Endozoicomonas sp. SM1973]|uniref:NADPH:quinone reductase n=1 Tax=Spartinivicinus marinus TaxID=2994442 RepID=A0A853HW33_9GAMM|nr:NADPH:quinone reductase [Spartinivicinus marinus]MCX4025239.1 NADPH:quinone reductase [Spartinivicinus marinus]NYZ65960.1 NADPH:quinone reductase [Spartinivicinus marinus]